MRAYYNRSAIRK